MADGEQAAQLLLIDVVNAHGMVVVQTIWAPTDALRYGRRETRTEQIHDQATLLDRLIALVPLIAGELPRGGNVVDMTPAPETAGPPIPAAAAA